MSSSGQNNRLEVSVNGRVVTTAAVSDLGLMDFFLSWARRDPARLTPEMLATPGFTPESWAGGEFEYGLGALDTTRSETLEWLGGELRAGDVLSLRVLPPGEVDEPAERAPVAGLKGRGPLRRRARPDGVAPGAEPGAAG
ncbi:hypothetical protein GobsT_16820 [Gemmata obscuriglobus]|uniref:Uncharacterized protein n=1 Tax=Gemmata obscuriglobus TaxID=114 RepID=A0A2Z3H8R2_9BACT|nr:hypothetical protein [Gemmata obscuriglobus]AWM39927.1 hypothetical protein C1280_24930 [Gemmata obscuriglobus]QEG26934.1 hypothetical protein GobsT_16820 [Gemmata obscuriglobus]VTS03092.1 unnamed protein product [Gemmata obscuriglobus UQM 2246]